MSTVPTITLDNGVEIPQLGLGVWQVEDEIVTDVVTTAFETGYRHVDTATIYGNEPASGGRSPRRTCRVTNCSSPPRCGTTTRATTAR